MRIAVYPGSFDPITLGHVDLIERGLRLFDRLIVGVGVNSAKKPMFETETRVELVRQALDSLPAKRFAAFPFSGMLGAFAQREKAEFILRGMRTMSDFDFEFQVAYANQVMYPTLETVFVATDPKLVAVSSSVVREILRRDYDRRTVLTHLKQFVPEPVLEHVRDVLNRTPMWFGER